MRSSGILVPIFSLPSRFGIGTLGKSAYSFVDFLKSAGQTYWQILPIGPAGSGNSPYLSYSSAAGNPYFIDLDVLKEQGLLTESDYQHLCFETNDNSIDYHFLETNVLNVLRKAYKRFVPNRKYLLFCRQNWVEEYAMFMVLKDLFGNAAWVSWPMQFKCRENEALCRIYDFLRVEYDFYCFLQFAFYEQWSRLRQYAHSQGIRIIGDIPIYVAGDSADVWAHPENFQLRDDLTPAFVSGCPPDAYSPDGQLWGSPLYDWDYMKKQANPFSWWKDRFRYAFQVFDIVRIDHFRGFEAYYSVPAGAKNARNGEWKQGIGKEFFDEIKRTFDGQIMIIAEDLGFIDDNVKALLQHCGFPGMKIMQFAFDSKESNDYLPHNYINNSVAYVGTHDNNTLQGWLKKLSTKEISYAMSYLNVSDFSKLSEAILRCCAASVADTAIFTIQDFLGLGEEARINIPGTPKGNWEWRIKEKMLNATLAKEIYNLTALYGRTPKLQ